MQENTFSSDKLTGICSTVDCLGIAMAIAVSKFLRKMAVIKRLAAMLEISGDLIALPKISNYLPLLSIDYTIYRKLRDACPELNLPDPNDIDAAVNLETLRSQVLNAYSRLDSMLNDHPWNRAGWLTNQADALYNELIGPLVKEANKISGFLACFQAICDTASSLESVSISDQVKMNDALTNIQNAPSDYVNALNDAQTAKVNKLKEVRQNLRTLAPQLNPLDYSDKGLGL